MSSPSRNKRQPFLSTNTRKPTVVAGVEAPKWAFPGDTEDAAVADPAFSQQHNNIHYDIMERHAIEVRFSTSGKAHSDDVVRLLRRVADAANREMPYGDRLDLTDDDCALVPTRTRNSNGDLEDVLPLLDRRVTIPLGTRSIAEHANLMVDELSKQTGLHIGCCQALMAGVPWGMAGLRLNPTTSLPARS